MSEVLLVILFLVLIFVNVYQVSDATKAGRIYRDNLLKIIEDLKKESPSKVLSESWLGFFLREIYLKDTKIDVVSITNVYPAKEYEKWLRKNQDNFKPGTMLISGIGGCVHYGAQYDGFRLNYFSEELDVRWKLYKEYNSLSYLSSPEPVRLWILSEK